ncbi:MAG: Acg family FMN-binding oxidoreductase [Succinivibrio sp.]
MKIKRLLKFRAFYAAVLTTLLTAGVFTLCCLFGVEKFNTSLNVKDKRLENVFYLASLAPSGHNTQMWSVELDEKNKLVKVLLDKSRRLDVVDPEFRESYISLGTYIRALELAFRANGFDAETQIEDDGATLSYRRINGNRDLKIISLIEKRHTEKREFSERRIDTKVLESLKNSFKDAEIITDNDALFIQVQNLTLDASLKQCKDKDAADELSKWLRLSDREANLHKDGLNAEQLGMSGIKKYFYYALTTHESVKGSMFENQSIKLSKNQIQSARAFVTVKSEEDSVKSLIRAGRTLYDLMLDLTDRNISIQPVSAVLEDHVSREFLEQLTNCNGRIQMVMRIGYIDGEYGTNNRFRRDLKDYITLKE